MTISRRYRLQICLVVALGLIVRLGYLLVVRRHAAFFGDPEFYFSQAKLISHGKGFIVPSRYVANGSISPSADHPPLFSYVLATLDRLGITTRTGQAIVQCFVGCVSIVLVIHLANRVVSPRAALLAGLMAALSPNIFYFDGYLLSETWSTLLILVSIAALFRLLDQRSLARAAMLGIAIGITSLARAEFLSAAPLVVVYLFFLGRKTAHLKQTILHASVMTAMVLAVVGPWMAYQAQRFEHPVGVSANFQFALPISNCDSVYYGENAGYWDVDCLLPLVTQAQVEGVDESVLASRATSQARDYIKQNTRRALVLPFIRVGRMLGIYKPLQQVRFDIVPESREPALAYSGLLVWYPSIALAAAGCLSLRRARKPIVPFLIAGVVAIFATAVTYGSFRFRAGFEPFVCILATVGFTRILQIAREIKAGSLPTTTSYRSL